jgi:hypothetical protein
VEPGERPDATAELALRWTRALTEDIGPRRPGSAAEARAAEWLRAGLEEVGVAARLERFPAYSTFAAPAGVVAGLAVGAGLLPQRARRLRALLALKATVLGALEDGLTCRPLARALTRGESRNVVAVVEPAGGAAARTVALVAHMDTSRSGLLFSEALAPHVRRLLQAFSLAVAVQGGEGLLCRHAAGRALTRAARAGILAGLGLLAERELRGEDVPGANDNASGAALTAALAAEASAVPLASTRIVLLVTGAEEAGLLGADDFLRQHNTAGWLFLNFDGVCAPATLRYLPREGLMRTWNADPGLLRIAGELAARRPELGLEPVETPGGLTYDATPVLARGGRALTISAQDGTIPHYHRPTDDARNIDPDTLTRALEIGRELIAAIDRGEADRA